MSSWRLGSGELVLDRPAGSHIHSGTAKYLPEALISIKSESLTRLEKEVDLGRKIGNTTCVKTSHSDEIKYAIRVGDTGVRRTGHSRFVLGRKREPSSTVVVVLEKAAGKSHYVLITAWIGQWAPVEPDDPEATPESWEFWQQHALIWRSEKTVRASRTNICPWKRIAGGAV